ncbi:Signal transduction histidine-protein kinase BarA [compost metagenome]
MNDILDISRLEADGLLLHKEPFGLSSVLQECMDLFEVITKEKNLKLQHEIEPSLPEHFIGDRARIIQILVNLIGNAV